MTRKCAVLLGLATFWVVALAGVAEARTKPTPVAPPPCATPGSIVEISASVRLTADYACSLSVVGGDPASPIVVDLAFHTVNGFVENDTNTPVVVRAGTVTGRVGPLERASDAGTSITIDAVHVMGSAGAVLGGDLTIRFSLIDGPVLVGGNNTAIHWSSLPGGIDMTDTNNSLALNITHNRINGSPAAGIALRDEFTRPDVGGVIGFNVISHSAGAGLDLADGADLSGLVVTHNRLVSNAGDGMVLGPSPFPSGGSVTVTANLAIGNGGHGFNLNPTAPDTVVDSGNNVAFFNHTQPQCVGLVCVHDANHSISSSVPT